jgi:hypothetical protein
LPSPRREASKRSLSFDRPAWIQCMNTVSEIECALKELPLQDVQKVAQWLQRCLDQQAAANHCYDLPNPFEEYGVTPEEVGRVAQRDLAAIRRDRNAGKLKPWKPGL